MNLVKLSDPAIVIGTTLLTTVLFSAKQRASERVFGERMITIIPISILLAMASSAIPGWGWGALSIGNLAVIPLYDLYRWIKEGK